MHTIEPAPNPSAAITARDAWRRRVARIGSDIQLAFAVLWIVRGMLATGWPGRLPTALIIASATVALAIWGTAATRGLAPRPRGPGANRLGRAITIATIAQLAASCALPLIVSAAGRPDLTITTVAITIGILLLWLWATLTTPGHLVAGILLIVVPGGLALALAGNSLTAAAGLATAAILIASAATGFRALASGALGSAAPHPDESAAARKQIPCRGTSGQANDAHDCGQVRVQRSRQAGWPASSRPRA
jgi:hypothetical protein